MTTLASGIGGIHTTASTAATTTQVANPRRRRINVCGLAGAAASNARPAAAASIRLNGTVAICLSATTALDARLSRTAGITGSLRHAAGLSRFLGPGTAVPTISTTASAGPGCAATSIAIACILLATLAPNVGAREPGNELPGMGIDQAGRISRADPSTVGSSALSTRSDGQLIHAGRQVLNGPRWSRTGAAAPTPLIS